MDSTTLSCDMNNGSIFILPLSFNPTSNYAITITNCPTDTNKVFSITIVNRQATSSFYINNLKVINNNNSYIFGTANSFSSPLFNGGPVTLANSPCVISQTFNIMSVPNTSNLSGDYTKCVTSSVNSHY